MQRRQRHAAVGLVFGQCQPVRARFQRRFQLHRRLPEPGRVVALEIRALRRAPGLPVPVPAAQQCRQPRRNLWPCADPLQPYAGAGAVVRGGQERGGVPARAGLAVQLRRHHPVSLQRDHRRQAGPLLRLRLDRHPLFRILSRTRAAGPLPVIRQLFFIPSGEGMENRNQNILRRSRLLISDLRRLKFLYPGVLDKIISIEKGPESPISVEPAPAWCIWRTAALIIQRGRPMPGLKHL
ncbi:hypothetical protein CBM2586_A50045 [Cupriavidus phytorum]|uniref:Uncharacterized protein n=1 Tax=Cupriavidus taiwanensis TaxID=164546 RepID=A0A975X7N3_9BURK|nr:hypothetical protein CBM2586_A50045 [Cupriavidus taiwanensis]